MVNFLSTKDEKNELLKQFQSLDLNGDGKLSREELIVGNSFKRHTLRLREGAQPGPGARGGGPHHEERGQERQRGHRLLRVRDGHHQPRKPRRAGATRNGLQNIRPSIHPLIFTPRTEAAPSPSRKSRASSEAMPSSPTQSGPTSSRKSTRTPTDK